MQRSIVLFTLILFTGSHGFAESKRVGGDYRVEKIDKKSDDLFVVEFKSVAQSGRFDKLVLTSDHVHFAIEQGQVVRLSAEIRREHKDWADVSQVLLFLPHTQGYTPIWLLSRDNRGDELGGSSYLEMHAPQSDYRIL